MTGFTLLTKPVVPYLCERISNDFLSGKDPRQKRIEDCCFGIIDTGRQTKNRYTTLFGIKYHYAGKDWAAVVYYCGAGSPDAPWSDIIRVYRKASSGQNQLAAQLQQLTNRTGDGIDIVGNDYLLDQVTSTYLNLGPINFIEPVIDHPF